jgi:hypothetical protein
MRGIPETDKVAAERCAIGQFVEQLDAGQRRKPHRTQRQQCFLQRAHGPEFRCCFFPLA